MQSKLAFVGKYKVWTKVREHTKNTLRGGVCCLALSSAAHLPIPKPLYISTPPLKKNRYHMFIPLIPEPIYLHVPKILRKGVKNRAFSFTPKIFHVSLPILVSEVSPPIFGSPPRGVFGTFLTRTYMIHFSIWQIKSFIATPQTSFPLDTY